MEPPDPRMISDLEELNRKTAYELWKVACPGHIPAGHAQRLIFPLLRSHAQRVSEQEARHIYCTMLPLLKDPCYYFALEAPTHETYIQSGKTPVSARTDLALYTAHGHAAERVANIEFKAHNATEGQIRKDVEKLIREGIAGNWFHLLSSSDSGTLPRLFTKLAHAFGQCSAYADHDIDIVVCLCVLDPREMRMKRFMHRSNDGGFMAYVHDFFAHPSQWPVEGVPEVT